MHSQRRPIFGGLLALGLFGATHGMPGQVRPAQQRPLTALPIAAKISVPGTPDWLGIGYGSVWVSSSRSNTVSRIDPLTNRVVATIPVGRQPNLGVAMGYNGVWITNCLDRTLSCIDPVLNRVVEIFPVIISGEGEGSIAVGEGGIWLTTNENGTHSGTLTRIDPTTHRRLATISQYTHFPSAWQSAQVPSG